VPLADPELHWLQYQGPWSEVVREVADSPNTAVLDRVFEQDVQNHPAVGVSIQSEEEAAPIFSLIGEGDDTEGILSSDWRDDALLLLLPVGLVALSRPDDEKSRSNHRGTEDTEKRRQKEESIGSLTLLSLWSA
jgi:hypothetical protein